MIKSVIFFVVCLFFMEKAYSQSENSSLEVKTIKLSAQEDKELNDRWNMALGSFQFQITNARLQPQVPISAIDMIEKNRLENKVNYIEYKENMRIMILPKSELKKEYEKLDLFKYISTN